MDMMGSFLGHPAVTLTDAEIAKHQLMARRDRALDYAMRLGLPDVDRVLAAARLIEAYLEGEEANQ